ncbi:polyketide synthase, putative [Talaromyces stipitatus ATCC 10500]|uniref:Polyketide synthase, putative n=1 Tax=Talaromyces stipitatus (strain ATCC 10500 / CBS 375.48 / QM 6759 / NRRL 1006) TaxID=441959 RepID=B8MP12_TALSN|nr:polyketide synthase, putative [Talaromyces stipitatus ATCC 10500]EED14251.1 polyketide synthase, putative [Talaromyces stipitatus ATCC 10500]
MTIASASNGPTMASAELNEVTFKATGSFEKDPIAIVGMAAKFPQEARTVEDLWNFLLQARQAMTDFPADRINRHGHYHPDPEHGGTFHVKGANFLLDDPVDFDAPFFKVTKTELYTLDPQQRLVMENTYHALENAGISMKDVTGSKTSVYTTGFNVDHAALLNADPETTLKYRPQGTTNSIIAGRVSWFYDLKGPCMTIDTACSSSMVALHLACTSLQLGESDMSIVAGANYLANPMDIMGMAHHGFLSPDGKCYSFDHRANGYARGEGVGSIVVKRLSDAIRDGNTIRAVIRGSGVNQDGRTAGITLPSASAQEDLIRKVYASAGLDPKDTRMLEAHGTGTSAGDPVEASAAAKIFGPHRSTFDPLYIGAIKSGIGHLEGGAGVAGVIKSVMVLESGIIPPNVNFEKPNLKVPVKRWNLKFPLENTPWPTEGVRRISVNSFGVGGTNAHVILDDAYSYLTSRNMVSIHNTVESVPTQDDIRRKLSELEKPATTEELIENGAMIEQLQTNGHVTNGDLPNRVSEVNGHINVKGLESRPKNRIFSFSSFDEQGIRRNATRIADYLKKYETLNLTTESEVLERLAFTLSEKRSKFPWKSFLVASSLNDLSENLTGDDTLTVIRAGNKPRIGYVFTGQGAQWHNMGKELLEYPVYRRSMEEASEYMKSIGAEWSVLNELLVSKENSRVNSPALSHPCCAALQIALVDLLASWDILPSRVVGHSSGEIAAAYAAGKLGRRAAWKAAYWRGVASAKPLNVKGAMLAVGLSTEDANSYIDRVNREIPGELIIACFNSPKNNTISGDEAKIDALKVLLDKDGVFVRKLNVTNAYHSDHMNLVADHYLQGMGDLTAESPDSRFRDALMYSSVTGELVTDSLLNARYWVENMVSPVLFSEALIAMGYKLEEKKAKLQLNADSEYQVDVILEIGPHGAMKSAIKETMASQIRGSSVAYMNVLDRTAPGTEIILNAVGSLSSRGYPVNIQAVNQTPGKKMPKMLVDLPPYSFDHAERIVYESRLSRNFRLRKHPRHDLFGAPVTDWNQENPRWRQIIRLRELPWLRDHIVTENFVYPGVGYIIMAVEACRQIADPALTITGFRLKDVSIKRALIIPDSKDGIETSLSITKMDEASMLPSQIWSRFAISSYNSVGDDWIEHCTGYISTEYEAKANPIDNGREASCEAAKWRETLDTTFRQCRSPMDINSIYDNLVTTGLNFGLLFRNLGDVKGSGQNRGEIAATLTVPDVAKVMPKQYMHPHLIHPSTMDSMFHYFLLSVLDLTGKATLECAIVPVFVKEAWLSAKIPSAAGAQMKGYGKSSMIAYEKYESDIMIWDSTGKEGLVSIKGLRATPLESNITTDVQKRNLCHTIEWPIDVDFLTIDLFSRVPRSPLEAEKMYLYRINRMQLAVMLNVTDALNDLATDFDPTLLQGHKRRYYEWLVYQKENLEKDQIIHLSYKEWADRAHDAKFKNQLYEEVAGYNGDGALAVRMGTNIVPFLKGETDPLQLMFSDDILDRVYDEVVALGDIPALFKEYLHHVYRNSSNLRILEIGAGTGASTAPTLNILSPLSDDDTSSNLTSRIIQYTFTDVSAGFFEKAKERFSAWSDIIEFKVYNAEKEPASQGLGVGTYDFVIAGNVVHTTTSLRKTLSNIHKLLKPGGKLLMQEGTRQNFLYSPVAFGQLPGWWQGTEPSRTWSPWVPAAVWETQLRESGFDGINLEFPDCQNPDLHTQSLFVATAIEGAKKLKGDDVVIVTSEQSSLELVRAVEDALKSRIGKASYRILDFRNLQSDKSLSSSVCVCMVELERGTLSQLTEEEYLNIRHLLSYAAGVLWVTGDIDREPTLGMIVGMMRSIRWERDVDEANLILLSTTEPRPALNDFVAQIIRVFDKQFFSGASESRPNAEYTLKDGIIYTNRLKDQDLSNEYLNSKFARSTPKMIPLGEAGRPVKLSTSAPGMLNKIEFVTDTVYNEPLADDLVEIEVKAVGLNFRDVMIAMGEHMAYSLGNEAAGIVSRVGAGVPDLKVGDRVVYMCGFEAVGCFHTYGRVQWQNVVKIPDSLSFEVAAGLPCVYSTVLYGLYEIARLSEGETILIHAAAGGVGQAAIHLAKNVGAEIFATVSSHEKRTLLMNEYGIPEDHIFSSRDVTFAKGIMRMTNGRGVDVLLNSLSGEALRKSWDIMAPFGRFIEIGKKDSQLGGRIELSPFLRQAMMASVELPMMMKHKPLVFRRLIAQTVQLYEEGKIKQAKPTQVLSYDKIEEALRTLQSGRGMGKIVLVSSPTDVVPIVPEQPADYRFDSNATYFLAGGLGGIGRSIGQWMASKGVKHIVFLSRTGKITESVQKMINDLDSKGCQAHIFACDVSDSKRVQAVVEEVTQSLPPIKGCIQGSMVLRDGMFENMSYDDFQAAILPKVQGSWNLHEYLPRTMDFFVMLSSATGILGNRSQANYAAGNTYQDFLARYRVSQNLPATSIDLGTVLSVGYVAEHRENMTTLANVLEVIREDEIHTLLEYVIDPRCKNEEGLGRAQLVVGLTTTEYLRQRGVPPLSYLSYPLFTHLNTTSVSYRHHKGEDPAHLAVIALPYATTKEEAVGIVRDGIRHKLASLLAIPVDNIDSNKSVSSNGVDSLVAMEFRTWLVKDLGAEVPLLEIMGTESLATISEKAATVSKLVR